MTDKNGNLHQKFPASRPANLITFQKTYWKGCVNGSRLAEEPPADHHTHTHTQIHAYLDFFLQHSFNELVNVMNVLHRWVKMNKFAVHAGKKTP